MVETTNKRDQFNFYLLLVNQIWNRGVVRSKEDLLHEVLELEAKKGLLASGESTKYQVGFPGVVFTDKN